jgi:hypothetical protein
VTRLTLVPFLPDGACAVIRTPDGRFALPTGNVEPGEDLRLDASLRILLMTAGFRRQAFREFARRGDEVRAWCEGDVYRGNRPHVSVPLEVGESDAIVAVLRDAGAADIADVVEEATASHRSVDRDAFRAEQQAWLEQVYLDSDTAEGGSGFSGTPEEWRAAREPVTDGIEHDGTFLDLGCANGLLMESVVTWCGERGRVIEPYGVDIGTGLVERARERLPRWADRIWHGDAATWVHPDGMRFEFVHTLLDCVERDRQAALVGHLLDRVVAPQGRLFASAYVASTDHNRSAAMVLRDLGYAVVDESRPRLDRPSEPPTTAWIDRA